MEKSNSIINSLKRLERASSENSRAAQKLKKTCKDVHDKVLRTDKNIISFFDFPKNINLISRRQALRLSCRISNGLLKDIAKYLEKRTKQSEKATEILENTFGRKTQYFK